MVKFKMKLLSVTLVALVGITAYFYLKDIAREGALYAGIVTNENTYSDLTASYYMIEGIVDDVIEDFTLDFKGETVTDYRVDTPTNSLKCTPDGLLLIEEGEGQATFTYKNSTLILKYKVSPNPNKPKTTQPSGEINEIKEKEAVKCTITANDKPANGVIIYIDDSKTAFKTTGTFIIPTQYIDNNTHSIYVAKFTSKGPVAYKLTEFTSLANEINFMNYNPEDVEITGTNINIKTELNYLF